MLRFSLSKGLAIDTPDFVAPHAAGNPVHRKIPIHRRPRAPADLPSIDAAATWSSSTQLSPAHLYSLDALRWLYDRSDYTSRHLSAFRDLSMGLHDYIDALGRVFHLRAIVIGPDRDRWALFDRLANHLRESAAPAEHIAEVEELATDPRAREKKFVRW